MAIAQLSLGGNCRRQHQRLPHVPHLLSQPWQLQSQNSSKVWDYTVSDAEPDPAGPTLQHGETLLWGARTPCGCAQDQMGPAGCPAGTAKVPLQHLRPRAFLTLRDCAHRPGRQATLRVGAPRPEGPPRPCSRPTGAQQWERDRGPSGTMQRGGTDRAIPSGPLR